MISFSRGRSSIEAQALADEIEQAVDFCVVAAGLRRGAAGQRQN
jgi:hypothetical protein